MKQQQKKVRVKVALYIQICLFGVIFYIHLKTEIVRRNVFMNLIFACGFVLRSYVISILCELKNIFVIFRSTESFLKKQNKTKKKYVCEPLSAHLLTMRRI